MSDLGLVSLLTGKSVLVTGVAEYPDGRVRAYLGPRYRGIYVNVDEDDGARVLGEWNQGGHLFTDKPPTDALRFDAEDVCDLLRHLWWGDSNGRP